MPELSKAFLQEIDNDNNPKSGKDPVPVQFNPTSLRMAFSNESEGGKQSGRQARQYTGSSSTTLSVDLVFDTADEGTTEVPMSVLERTKEVEYFMTPQAGGGQNSAPPRVCFQWGNLIVNGVLESLSVDLDHFAHDGTPLRAKASLSIKGQHPEYQFNEVGPGANEAAPSSPADALAGIPGLNNNPLSDALAGINSALGAVNDFVGDVNEVMQALEGESLAELAARAGLDPEGWRALADGLSNPLNLSAGLEIGIGGGIGLSLGVGGSLGVQVGAEASVSSRVGLGAPTTAASSRVNGQLEKGYALSGAGGVGAALETVKADAGVKGSTRAKQDFRGASGAQSTRSKQDAISAAASTTGTRNQVFSLRADPRATTFGSGVPLRDRVLIAQDERANLLAGQARLKSNASLDGLPPTTTDPAIPGWRALPTPAVGAEIAAPRSARGCGCGCGGSCGCSKH